MFYSLTLLLPFYTSFFWAITLFCQRKNNTRSQNIWIGTTILMSISTYIWSVMFAGIDDFGVFYKLELLEGFTTLLLLPMLHFSFRSLTNEKSFGWKEYLLLAPAVLIGGSMTILYSIMGDTQATVYIREMVENQGRVETLHGPVYRIHNFIGVYLYAIVIVLQIVYVLIYATIALIKYRKRLKNFFSSYEEKSLENGAAMLIGLYLILFLSLLSYRGRFHYNEPSVFISLLMVIWAVVIYYMGYNVAHLKYTATEFAHELEQADSEANCSTSMVEKASLDDISSGSGTNRTLENLAERFEKIIDEDKIFLQKNLHIQDVANILCTNRTYISRLINEKYKCTFSDFINNKRITYARELILSNPGMTQEEIADKSGFAYHTGFSRVFKRYSGITFREWQKKNLT